MHPLDWTDYSTVAGTTLDRAEIAGGAIWMVSGPNVQGYRLRFAPDYPAGIGSPQDARAALAAIEEGTGDWHRARALSEPLGIAIGAVCSRYLGFALIEASRERTVQGETAPKFRRSVDGDREILAHRNAYGTLTAEFDADGWRIAFVRHRGRRRTAIATLSQTGLTASGERFRRPLPPGWDEPGRSRDLALYCAGWAERCGLTGPAFLTDSRGTRGA